MISFLRRTKLAEVCWNCIKKKQKLILNHYLNVINRIFWKVEFSFSSNTQAWLLPNLLNQEITQILSAWF